MATLQILLIIAAGLLLMSNFRFNEIKLLLKQKYPVDMKPNTRHLKMKYDSKGRLFPDRHCYRKIPFLGKGYYVTNVMC